jgi:hypothetical protein
MGVSVFNLADYVENSNLGPLIAATYMTVEEGRATVSLSPTFAVVTSTLAVPPSGTSSAPGTDQTAKRSAAVTSQAITSLAMALVVTMAFALA